MRSARKVFSVGEPSGEEPCVRCALASWQLSPSWLPTLSHSFGHFVPAERTLTRNPDLNQQSFSLTLSTPKPVPCAAGSEGVNQAFSFVLSRKLKHVIKCTDFSPSQCVIYCFTWKLVHFVGSQPQLLLFCTGFSRVFPT